MRYSLARPPAAFDPGQGLLFSEHFQMAYLTNDMARAKTLFGDRLGLGTFSDLEGPMPEGGYIKAAFAWAGTLMYELIEVADSALEIYAGWLPQDGGFHVRHHHLGFLTPDRAQFDGVIAGAGRENWRVAYVNSNPLVDAAFVQVPELGHYLEYLLPTPAGLAFFDSVPRR